MQIPFNRPYCTGKEFDFIKEAILGMHLSGDGIFTKKCNKLLESLLEIPKVLLTTSCTHALEMAAILLDIEPGDEVIVPSFSFVSTVNAFVLRGARPIFIDIRPDTLNLDEQKLESLITKKTKAIVLIHYSGIGCEMDKILEIAGRRGVAVVEDNAHGLFGKYKEKPLGTFGTFATLSFHETKNISCGEGGALIINDPAFIERAEFIREKGTNRSKFFRGEIEKYTWVDIGSSYLPSEILAAFLYAQLEAREKIQKKRKEVWNNYYQGLNFWAQQNKVELPLIPTYCENPYHSFFLILPNQVARDSMICHLKDRGIQSVFHYLPLHLSKMGQKYGGKREDCKVTEDISGRLLRLPFFFELSKEDQIGIIGSISDFPVK